MQEELVLKIGQMICAGFPSPFFDDQARRMVEKYRVGNFVLFARNFNNTEQTCNLCNDLSENVHKITGYAPLIAVDQEGGAVSRIYDGGALIPGAMAISASHTDKTYDIGRNTGKILKAMGINTDFAPVLDININPQNPIIGTRSFGDTSEVVEKYGLQMFHGLQKEGIITGVKHYPGYGNVNADSHLGIPINTVSREVLKKTEWMPFERAFEEGAEALMTSHVKYKYVDNEYPSTLSYKIMTELLRKEHGFKGVAITDCMEMGAIADAYGIGEGTVRAIEAGCDILTFSHTFSAVEEAVLSIYQALETGRITPNRIEESYMRIIQLKERHGLVHYTSVDAKEADNLIHNKFTQQINSSVAFDSITLLKDCGGIDAIAHGMPRFFAPLSLALTGAEDEKKEKLSFSKLAAEVFGGQGIDIPLNKCDNATENAINGVYDVAVIGLYNARFRTGQIDVLRKLEASGKTLIVLLLGAPYDMSLIKRADAIIAAYEYTPLSVHALIEAISKKQFNGIYPLKMNK